MNSYVFSPYVAVTAVIPTPVAIILHRGGVLPVIRLLDLLLPTHQEHVQRPRGPRRLVDHHDLRDEHELHGLRPRIANWQAQTSDQPFSRGPGFRPRLRDRCECHQRLADGVADALGSRRRPQQRPERAPQPQAGRTRCPAPRPSTASSSGWPTPCRAGQGRRTSGSLRRRTWAPCSRRRSRSSRETSRPPGSNLESLLLAGADSLPNPSSQEGLNLVTGGARPEPQQYGAGQPAGFRYSPGEDGDGGGRRLRLRLDQPGHPRRPELQRGRVRLDDSQRWGAPVRARLRHLQQ